MLRRRDPDPQPVEIVVGTFTDPHEAESAASLLRENGILAKATTIATAKLSARGEMESVKFGVSVDATDSRRAIEILQDRITRAAGEGVDIDLEEPLEVPPEPIQCPECGSERVRSSSTILTAIAGVIILVTIGWLTGFEELFYLAAAIVGLILALGPNRRCTVCGHRWME